MYTKNHYPDLLTKEELETILNITPLMTVDRFKALTNEEFSWDHNAWVLDEQTIPPPIVRYLIDHYTCYLRDCTRFTKKLNKVAKELENLYHVQADAHIYINKNPKVEHPFGIHFDSSTNLIVQCVGVTNFKVWTKEVEDKGAENVRLEMEEAPGLDVDLEPGDSLYIPAYMPHLATSKTPRFSVSFPMTQPHEFEFKSDRNWIRI